MEREMKLFAICLGGRTLKTNIELHDVVFVAGTSLQETFPKLKKMWVGYPAKVPHIDSYIELRHADGFEISLRSEVSRTQEYKLYFINYGAYTENLFGEVHQCAFYVAKNRSEATQKARKELCLGMDQVHLDDHLDVEEEVDFGIYAIDDVIEVDTVDGYHLHFTPSNIKTTSLAHPGYLKLKVEQSELV